MPTVPTPLKHLVYHTIKKKYKQASLNTFKVERLRPPQRQNNRKNYLNEVNIKLNITGSFTRFDLSGVLLAANSRVDLSTIRKKTN